MYKRIATVLHNQSSMLVHGCVRVFLARDVQFSMKKYFGLLMLCFLLISCGGGGSSTGGSVQTPEPDSTGQLALTVVDEKGELTAARIEIVDLNDRATVPLQAILVDHTCLQNKFSGNSAAEELRYREIDNPFTGTRQFYLDKNGVATRLQPGRYRIRIFKGIEYLVHETYVQIESTKTSTLREQLERWENMPEQGWYSSDDHIHFSRLNQSDNERIAAIVAAEDINVANLLQMGAQQFFDVSEQYEFGEAGVYREGATLLLSGQEHPRTHILGHAIILGSEVSIDKRDTYIDYYASWVEAKAAQGVIGYAHLGEGAAANGISIDAPTGLLSFIEILQADLNGYSAMYSLLNVGIPIAPTAGSDFPCLDSLPGRERFYTLLEGDLDRANWLAGVEAGRTFVTNGPMLTFSINDHRLGDTVNVGHSEILSIQATVKFDRSRDDIKELQLIRNGHLIASWENFEISTDGKVGQISAKLELTAEMNAWYALRATGSKIKETPWRSPGSVPSAGADNRPRPSEAHTAPIYVYTGNVSNDMMRDRTSAALLYLSRLDRLREIVTDPDLEEFSKIPDFGDLVTDDHLRENLPALLDAIDRARMYYSSVVGGG